METSTPNILKVESSFKILHFLMGDIDFAIRLSDVNEIVKLTGIRKIPRVPSFIEGVLHLRGELVVIVSLRKLLNVEGESPEKSKIIILSLFDKKIGFIVDEVTKILQKQENEILPPPPVVLKGLAPDCMIGVFKENNRNILMLNLKRTLAVIEEESINQVLQRELSFLINQINE
jgi:purine-binding chemotaxis protein CheW